jgi:ATPase subunit of ABC transporter with duplicated ATPase domains
MDEEIERGPRIVVVGPCAAGKTTLVSILRSKGYNIRSCVQEHSFTPDLWKRFSKADVLVFLDAALATIAQRQHRSDWTQTRLDGQHKRLAHARAHCDLYLPTDDLVREQVAETVAAFLQARGVTPHS